MSGEFVLVASYPKSGNTWARIVFSRLRQGTDFPLNGLDGSFHGMLLRLLFDQFAPVNAADLLADEIENFLPGVLRQVAAESPQQVFIKVHDVAHRTQQGEWLYPPEFVRSAVYLVRHPYDVAASTAHHFGVSPEKAVEAMVNERAMQRAYTRLPEPLPQYFGTWSGNVSSWLDDAPYAIALARYEDLLADPVPQFLRLASAAGLSTGIQEISQVVEASRFERLQKEEQEYGFLERPKTSPQFFRAGRARSWEGILDKELRDKLLRDHGAMMERLGYTADGGVVSLPIG